MVKKKKKTYQKNGVETIVDNDGIFCLNERHKKKG